jgi:hypothetical protein
MSGNNPDPFFIPDRSGAADEEMKGSGRSGPEEIRIMPYEGNDRCGMNPGIIHD